MRGYENMHDEPIKNSDESQLRGEYKKGSLSVTLVINGLLVHL